MNFTKMHGIGNDFILMHGLLDGEIIQVIEHVSFLCDRHKSIGADGVILVLPTEKDGADYRMRIFNSDGSEAQMCGNGIRCFSLYLNEKNISGKSNFVIETAAGFIKTERFGNNIRVDMGKPILEAAKIPTAQLSGNVIMHQLDIKDRRFNITAVSMGNPHAVIYADELSDDLIFNWAPQIQMHSFFPDGVNVEFIHVDSDDEITMRVFERGCGETLACGTGACASVVSGIINKKHKTHVTVHLLGGDLSIFWDNNRDHSVFMEGLAKTIFTGEITL